MGTAITLLSAATNTGAGTAQAVGANKTVVIEAWSTATAFTVDIQISRNSGAFYNLAGRVGFGQGEGSGGSGSKHAA